MTRLDDFFATPRPSVEQYSVADWNDAVEEYFAPYVRDPAHRANYKEVLRAELVNLALASEVPGHVQLLDWTTTVLRSALQNAGDDALRYLVRTIPCRARADEAGLALFAQDAKPGADASTHDLVGYYFKLIESGLEGCFRPRFEFLSAQMHAIHALTPYPATDAHTDFGKLVADVPPSFEARGALYLRDPIFNVRVSQWRNIGAHRSFAVVGRDAIRAEYGKSLPRHVVTMTIEQLRRVVTWTVDITRTLRLAETLFFLDHAAAAFAIEPVPSSLPMRLESALAILFHNYSLVGFTILRSRTDGDAFVVTLRDRGRRPTMEAIIHASQMLPSLAAALDDDPSRRGAHTLVRVELVDNADDQRAYATLSTAVGVAYVQRQATEEELVDAVDWKVLKADAATVPT